MNDRHVSRRLRVAFALLVVGGVAAVAIAVFGPSTGDEQDRSREESPKVNRCGADRNRVVDKGGWFTDVTDEWGVDFAHQVGPPGSFFVPEINGTGGALFDYDNDGDLDLYLMNSGKSPHATGEFPRGTRTENRLFRQESTGKFVDVTDESGLGDTSFGIGCAVADVDNDGDIDVYITNYGQDRLFANQGDGTFVDITEAARIPLTGWGTCAAFFDYDRDGDLDVYVAHYGAEEFDKHPLGCDYGYGHVAYCSPREFTPSRDHLLMNEGPDEDGIPRFSDVSSIAGIDTAEGTGFGVITADFDGDQWPDVYVANDMYPNRLWINQRDGTFIDEGMLRGAALNYLGQNESSMGMAVGDFDGDRDLDLVATHITGETNTFYVNDGSGRFLDSTESLGQGQPSQPHTGWGAAFADFNADGHLDLAVANGLVLPCEWRYGDDAAKAAVELQGVDDSQYWSYFADRNQLLIHRDGELVDNSELAGDFARHLGSARALITGDIDNDGDVDLVVTYCGGRARIYRNDMPRDGNWLGLRILSNNRDAYGATVTVRCPSSEMTRVVQPSFSYLASNDPRLYFGLGDFAGDCNITVHWPDGSTEEFAGPSANAYHEIRQGAGDAVRSDDQP